MTDFAVTGKKRTGKGLFCVGMMREKLAAGCRVVTNMDIFMDQLVGPWNTSTIIRLPDCPTVADMEAIGRGYEGDYDDERNGIIVLDEASKYFNTRQFGDKERQPLLDWLIHSGKLGWDVYYQMQGLPQIDKQIRETQIEYHCSVKRTDKWPIPFVTPICKMFGLNVRFPRMHVGIVRQGVQHDAMIVDRHWYRSHELHKAYDTRQVFLDRDHPQACGLHTVLSAWHIKGRHLAYIPNKTLRYVFGLLGYDWQSRAERQALQPKPQLKPKHHLAVLLSRLPPDQAVRHWRRFEQLGAFNA